MKNRTTIYRITMVAALLVVVAGMLTILIAAGNRRINNVCKKVDVVIKGSGDRSYLEQADIIRQLEGSLNGKVEGQVISRINLDKLENVIKADPWIRDAEIYFDNQDVLHVVVRERQPVARIFTTSGSSFYMDTAGIRMPLRENMATRLPVITGFTGAKRLNAKDSALLKEVKTLAGYIYGHQFWNAQIGQVEVTPERKFELVPVIGDHIIRVGNSENLEEKLNNLLVFYRQVLSKSGLNKYSILDVQYEGQVVAVKRGAVSNVDSIQLKKNIQEMLNKKIDEVQDAAAYPVVAIKDSSNKSVGQIPPVPMKTNSNPIEKQPMNTAVSTAPKKTVNTAVKPAVKKSNPVEKPKKEIRKPKAVMKKQGTR